MATIGTLIDGKYEILKLIGKGGMSEVYLAMDKNLNKQWAVKEIKKKARDKNNEIVVQSAIAEANLMKKLDHPCLPRIVDILDREDVIYVVMDYIEGEPLSKIIKKNGALPQDEVISWAEDLCGVLDYLHSQDPPIIYRDMKPANVMLQPNGNIKLIDFGIAREYKQQNLEDTVSLGTKGYAAPEQFGGKGQTDARTDIYCLGVTMYHLLTGHNPCEPPYELYPIRYWDKTLSAGLEAVIQKCTQLNPEDRYQSCAELLYAIKNHEKADVEYVSEQMKKVKLVAGFALASAICLVVGITGAILQAHTNNTNFESYILQAQKATTEEEMIDDYVTAINILPNKCEGYLGLVEAMKADASFSLEEESILKKCINPNLASLRKQKDYGELAFEIGKLYWYYYEYGLDTSDDNELTRMKSSTQWFSDAVEYSDDDASYKNVAKIYGEIGEFNKDVTLSVEEASDKGTYAPYFENLKELTESVSEDDAELVSLEAYKLCIYSIENYARKFKADDISQKELQGLYDEVLKATKAITTTTDKTTEMKDDIIKRSANAQSAITTAFSSGN